MIKTHFNIFSDIAIKPSKRACSIEKKENKFESEKRREKKRNEMKRGEIFSISRKEKELNAIR